MTVPTPLSETFSGDSTHDADYILLQVIRPDGVVVKLRMDNSNNLTWEVQ